MFGRNGLARGHFRGYLGAQHLEVAAEFAHLRAEGGELAGESREQHRIDGCSHGSMVGFGGGRHMSRNTRG
ncbi:hypothetical protein GCM10027088_27780 [Nocardia goodfellowii]